MHVQQSSSITVQIKTRKHECVWILRFFFENGKALATSSIDTYSHVWILGQNDTSLAKEERAFGIYHVETSLCWAIMPITGTKTQPKEDCKSALRRGQENEGTSKVVLTVGVNPAACLASVGIAQMIQFNLALLSKICYITKHTLCYSIWQRLD